MASPSGEKYLLPDSKRAIEELIIGKEYAVRAESRLKGDTETAALMDAVTGSISRALSYLDPYSDDISGGKRKTSLSGDKRGCYRKRTLPPSTRKQMSGTTDDGYIWRKYGQKDIQGARHPRSYYRCLHKNDQGCQATRQVEKSSQDPSQFLITYLGEHTCKEPSIPNNMKPNSSSLKEESLISFASEAFSINTHPRSSSFSSAEFPGNLTPGSSFSDTILMPNVGSYEDYGDINLGINDGSINDGSTYEGSTHGGTLVSDHVMSGLDSVDTSFMIESFDHMDDIFCFDEVELYFKDAEGAPFF